MKKLAMLVAIGMFVVLMAGCGGVNSELNKANTSLAKTVITAVDDYLEGEIFLDELREIADRALANVDKSDFEQTEVSAALLRSHINVISVAALINNSESTARIIEYRNNIAELIGAGIIEG